MRSTNQVLEAGLLDVKTSLNLRFHANRANFAKRVPRRTRQLLEFFFFFNVYLWTRGVKL